MYKNSSDRRRKPNSKGRSFSSSRGLSGRRFSSSNGRGRKGGGRNFTGSKINISRFVSKAISLEETNIFSPKNKFSDFAISESLKRNILSKGYNTPTPIQDSSVPIILEGRDIVGIANTGTGKTGAFLIPLIDKILRNRSEKILIMVPTRELALQVEEEFISFSGGLGIRSVSCVGGANIGSQIRVLKNRPNIVVGTPGRLKDLMERKALNLSGFGTVVLDEADRMLDMGFIGDMKFILSKMSLKRHTLFFSATLSSDIEKLVGSFLNNPVRISVKKRETVSSVEQNIIRTPKGKDKLDVLHDLLITQECRKVLVFGRTKYGVEKLAKILIQRGFKAESIHGNKTQNKRQKSLSLFKSNKVSILVATDVAARGIDVDDISHVINYDIPATYDDYIHRIGRTGRAGKKGCALTFI